MDDQSPMILFDHQQEFLDALVHRPAPLRACLYFKTGAGKSLASLLGVKQLGHDRCLVIAPPSTHAQWVALGQRLDVAVEVMSHAKFRMPDTKVSRTVAIIADEFHLFGGQKGKGWRKLDGIARHLQAPMILLSATPNYNDAERCYCVQHILDPGSCPGGYLQFIYQNCTTEQNPFGMEPKVTGFQAHATAADYLAALPGVFHLPDDLIIDIEEIEYKENLPEELERYGYNQREHRMVASQIEMRHATRYQGLVDENGYLHSDILTEVLQVLAKSDTVLIYANHATIAEAVGRSLQRAHLGCHVVTGRLSKADKTEILSKFRAKQIRYLIGTATLATGTDGMDRVCDTLLILDDTDDDSLRRQLIGRIMPRGDFVSVADKKVFRMVPLSA